MSAESQSEAKPEEAKREAKRQEGEAGKQKEEKKQQGKQQSTEMVRREPAWPSLFGGLPWGASPFVMMRRMFDDLDRMFEELTSQAFGRELVRRGAAPGEALWAPQVDVLERGGKLVVRADLPGISKEDISVEVTPDGLVLQGERRRDVEEEKGGVYRRECSYGAFRRLVPLPEGVDPDTADARFHDGVLEVTFQLPKERARGKRIEIREGEKPSVH